MYSRFFWSLVMIPTFLPGSSYSLVVISFLRGNSFWEFFSVNQGLSHHDKWKNFQILFRWRRNSWWTPMMHLRLSLHWRLCLSMISPLSRNSYEKYFSTISFCMKLWYLIHFFYWSVWNFVEKKMFLNRRNDLSVQMNWFFSTNQIKRLPLQNPPK